MNEDQKHTPTPTPKLPKGGSAATAAISSQVQRQADREFLMNAWLTIAKQAIAHTLPSTATDNTTVVALPTRVVEEMKVKLKEGFFDV